MTICSGHISMRFSKRKKNASRKTSSTSHCVQPKKWTFPVRSCQLETLEQKEPAAHEMYFLVFVRQDTQTCNSSTSRALAELEPERMLLCLDSSRHTGCCTRGSPRGWLFELTARGIAEQPACKGGQKNHTSFLLRNWKGLLEEGRINGSLRTVVFFCYHILEYLLIKLLMRVQYCTLVDDENSVFRFNSISVLLFYLTVLLLVL